MNIETGTDRQLFGGMLVEKYYDRVYPVILRMVANDDIARDLTQDVFLKAWENRHKFRGDSDPGTWLYRIGVNLTLTYLGKQKKISYEQFDDLNIADSKPSSLSILESVDEQTAVRNAVNALPPQFKAVLVMHYYEDMKIDRISEILDLNKGTVAWRLFRARKLLEKRLRRSGIDW